MKTPTGITFAVTVLFLFKILITTYHQILNIYDISINQASNLYFYNFDKDILINAPKIGLLLSSGIVLLATIVLAFSLVKVLVVSEKMSIFVIFEADNSNRIVFLGYSLLFFAISLSIATFIYMMYLNPPPLPHTFTNQNVEDGYVVGRAMGYAISRNFGIFVVSSFVLLLGNIVENGVFLKQENDLTI